MAKENKEVYVLSVSVYSTYGNLRETNYVVFLDNKEEAVELYENWWSTLNEEKNDDRIALDQLDEHLSLDDIDGELFLELSTEEDVIMAQFSFYRQGKED